MKACIGLGSNLGDREAMIRIAIDDLARLPGTKVLRASSLYDTEPVGDEDQPHFLNAACEIDTELTARQLLWNLLLIEKRLGRVRTHRYGPRTIDLDLLTYGPLVIDEPDLQVPHPEMATRSFVLVPMLEIDPLAVHPGNGEPLAALLEKLSTRPPTRRGSRLWN
jgi:2-amino-4-hydroxy-6-hydroxymethyldihydropteridine diphosphokinase